MQKRVKGSTEGSEVGVQAGRTGLLHPQNQLPLLVWGRRAVRVGAWGICCLALLYSALLCRPRC